VIIENTLLYCCHLEFQNFLDLFADGFRLSWELPMINNRAMRALTPAWLYVGLDQLVDSWQDGEGSVVPLRRLGCVSELSGTPASLAHPPGCGGEGAGGLHRDG
jgi:hypothetical protein